MLREFYLAASSENVENLKLLLIKEDGDREVAYSIVDNLKIKQEHDALLYKVTLEPALKSEETRRFTVSEIYSNRMDPLPKAIKVHED